MSLALAGGTTLALLVLCFIPGTGLPAEGPPGTDKLLHVIGFFGTCLMWRLAGLRRATVFLIGLGLAAATEVTQHALIPGRHGDALDLLADLAGTLLAVVPSRRPGLPADPQGITSD